MNVKLLLKVKKHILAKPSRLRMSSWIESKKLNFFDVADVVGRYFDFSDSSRARYGEPTKQRIPDCGTVGCIAGWTCVLSKKMPDDAMKTSTLATELLGLRSGEGTELFFPSYWPFDLYEKYINAKTARQRAKIVGQRIDRMIEENHA